MYIYLLIFGVSLLFLFLLQKWGRAVHLVSKPSPFPGSREGIPLSGGWGLFLFSLFSFFKAKFPPLIMAGMGGIFLMGLFDDIKELSPLPKLIIQSLCALMVISSSFTTTIGRIPFFLNYAITFLWIVGITNALNFLDIMDGLSAIVGVSSSAGILLVSWWNGNSGIFLASGVILSYLLAFLLYNLPPAKIFLGNSGSYLLGFLLSLLVIPLSFAPPGREVALLTPLLLLGLPLLDTFYLIIRRWKKGKPVYRKSEDHLAFLLLKKGWGIKKILLFIGGVSVLFSLTGIALTRWENRISLIFLFSLFLFLLALFRKVLR